MSSPSSPHGVVVERNLLIPLPDGVRLAADLFRPAGDGRWPALVDFLPYHKDGRGGRQDVEAVNRHFAARGYAALTVDLRGLGSSDGVNRFPFDPQEARDGHEAVEWVARQPWCDGNVGMWGVSYGGITALAVAATRPPHLRAIVPIHACADIYHDFVAPGGCRGGFWSHADWGPRMVRLQPHAAAPRGPGRALGADLGRAARGQRALALRLVGSPEPRRLLGRARHSRSSGSSARPSTSAGGGTSTPRPPSGTTPGSRRPSGSSWAPGSTRSRTSRSTLPPPASTRSSDGGSGGFAAGTTAVTARAARHALRPGRPRGLATRVRAGRRLGSEPEAWHLGPDGTLGPEPPGEPVPPAVHAYDPTIGVASIAWDPWSTGLDPALPWDQSGDDARSLTFTSAPLAGAARAGREPVGRPGRGGLGGAALPGGQARRRGAERALDAGRRRVARARACRRRDRPSPDATRRVTVPLRATAYRLAAGHRLRLAVACADFPRLWPTPAPAELRVHPGASHVVLPRAPAEPGAAGAGLGTAPGRAAPESRRPRRRAAVGDAARPDGRPRHPRRGPKEERVQLDPLTRLHGRHRYTAAVASRRPDLARMESTTEIRLERPVGGDRARGHDGHDAPPGLRDRHDHRGRQARSGPGPGAAVSLTARNLEAPHEPCDAMRVRSSPRSRLPRRARAGPGAADRRREGPGAPKRVASSGSPSSATRRLSTRTGPPRTSWR